MFIPDPNFNLSRIPDLGSNNSNKRGTKLAVLLFSVATNFSKLKITYFVSEQMQKKICATRQKIIVTKLSNIFVGDQVTETRDPEKNLSRIQCSKRHRIPNPASLLRKKYNLQHLGAIFPDFQRNFAVFIVSCQVFNITDSKHSCSTHSYYILLLKNPKIRNLPPPSTK